MTSADGPGRRIWRTIGVMAAVAATIGVVVLVTTQSTGPAPSAAAQATTASTSPALTESMSPASTARAACTEDSRSRPSGLTSPACPSAILAVELAVAPVRLPIERMVIEPGPFFCDDIWPGAGSTPPCYGPFVRPGQFMHAWVSFTGSAKIAAVALGLNLPAEIDAPGASRPPWQTTLVAVEVPPDGWVMP